MRIYFRYTMIFCVYVVPISHIVYFFRFALLSPLVVVRCRSVLFFCFFYIDSPPNRSPGRKEFRLDGVALDWSPESSGVEPHKLVEEVFGQPVLHVLSAADTCCLPLPRHVPEEADCWLATCCKWRPASHSVGFSARIVVLPRTQLLSACWAWSGFVQRKLFGLNILLFIRN